MKKIMRFLFVTIILLTVCGCRNNENTNYTNYNSSKNSTVEETQSQFHSSIYHSDYTVDQIIQYFEEIVLDMEYSDGEGDVTLVQKWTSPIRYRYYGEYTNEDINVLNDLFEKLNKISGFPGIYEAQEDETENLTISFLDPHSFEDSFSDILDGEDAFGATQFWYYTESNEIHTAKIGYRTDLDQQKRNSILLEEVINMLGIDDTKLREDSIVYQYSDDNTSLSTVDEIIIKLLYDPQIKCGMDFEKCKEIIKKLYY